MSLTPSIKELQRQLHQRDEDLRLCNERLAKGDLDRKRVEKEMLATTLKEQRRFGTQLHDGLCQELTGGLLLVKGLTQKMEKENDLNAAELKKISALIDRAVTQARDAARGLYPGDLDGSSLVHMLEELSSSTQESSGVSCCFYCPNPILITQKNVATYLYKIAREGICNAVKYGKAQLINVGLIQNDENIILTITDNGVGFIGDPKKTDGIGLKLMQYRAQAMDACLQVTSNVPHGVTLKCSLQKGPQ